MTRLRAPAVALLAALAAAAPGPRPAAGQDDPPKKGPGLDDEPLKPLTPEEQKAAEALFKKAKDMVAKGGGIAARPLFEDFLEKYPGADEEMVREADDRSGPNFLAGINLMHDAGPSARRLDFELMADGYTTKTFRLFEKEAITHMGQFWREPLYAEYENYINVWRFDLVSLEEGVDDVSPVDKGEVPPDDPKKRKRYEKALAKKLKNLKRYSTALNCQAAGPGGQVMADRDQVLRWRRYLPESDQQTIAFARKGQLGMGGGGIATTGRNVALVHEVGHAFIGLLDEYVNNPGRGPKYFAPNAVSTDNDDPKIPPPVDEIPWKHWLLYKPKPADVGVLLGGATYALGVFRPAGSCAMNTGGGKYCTVCREAGVLAIYSFVSPIDESGPEGTTVRMNPTESREFFVRPMQPKSRTLPVDWTLQVLAPGAPPPGAVEAAELPPAGEPVARDERASGMWNAEGGRASERRENPLPEGNPRGAPVKAVVSKIPGGFCRSTVKIEKLPPGLYRLTARVFDDTKVAGSPIPWVIKDPERLREEWRTWILAVGPEASAPVSTPGSTPGSGGGAAPAPGNPPK